MRTASWRMLGELAVFALLVLAPASVFAQEATLSGTVTDTTGGVLPGVTITATHTATGNTFVAVTDEKGGYRIPVRVGMFKVDAELPGFGTVTRQVDLLIGQTGVLNLQMAPSTVQESVTVTGEAPLVDTTNSTLASNVDPRQMQELPVNGRNWMDLTLLAPGSRANAVAETPIGSTSSNITFQLNLDGQQVTNQVALSFGQPRYSRDAIGEFEFVSNRFDASQGRSSGIQVNAITKSGTNTPGGTFSGYFRDAKFNAADPVATDAAGKHIVLPYQDQQISSTFGGPIIKDRIHYFLSYEYEREPQTYVYNTPYPKFNGTLTGARRQDTEMGRFDFQFSPKTRLSLRGNRYDNRIPYDSRYTGGSDKTASGAIGTNRRSEQEYGSFTQVLGSQMVNEIRGGHSLFHWNQFAHVKNANSLVGQTPGFGAPVINLRGFTLGQPHAITPQNIREEDYDIQDSFTMSFNARGRHDLKAGGEYMHDFTWENTCQTCMGQYTSNSGTPLSADVIQNMIGDINDVSTWNLAPLSPVTTVYLRNVAMAASPFSRPAGNNGFTEYAPRHVVAWWAQDDWHATNRLTLNLGVRYDANIDEFVNWVAFEPFIKAGRPQDLNNLAPRLGFNYALNNKTVIRGGYGIYYGTATGQPPLFTLRYVQQIAMTVNNDGRPDFAVNPFNGPAPTYDQAKALLCAYQPNPASPTCNLRHSTSNFAAPDIVDPWSRQASIGFQRQIGSQASFEADWVYTGDRQQLTTRNINISYNPVTGVPYPLTGTANYINRPYPGWGNITMNRSDGQQNYNALQTSFTKRMANHWQASATYTYSRVSVFDQLPLNPGCQYPVTTVAGSGVYRCDQAVTLPEDLASNAWYAGNDQHNRATFNGIWEAPYGLQLSGLYIFGDNGWLTPTAGFDFYQQGSTGGRRLQDGTVIARNSLDAPPLHRVDMRLQKRLSITSKFKVDGILEVFNLFNRANFDPTLYTTNKSNAKFGQPNSSTTLAYSPRMLQFGFRTQF